MLAMSLDLFLRLVAYAETLRMFAVHLFCFSTLIDCLMLLPYWVQKMRGRTEDYHRLLVFRLFRLYSLVRVFDRRTLLRLSVDALCLAVVKGMDTLLLIFAILALLVLIFATLVYLAERGRWNAADRSFRNEDGTPSSF